jgi:magnesium chelatase subunit I
MLLPAITGKVEMVYEGEQQGAEVVARRLIGQAVAKLFESKFPPVARAGQTAQRERQRYDVDADELDDMFAGRRQQKRKAQQNHESANEPKNEPKSDPNYDVILAWFAHENTDGNKITLSDEQPFSQYFAELKRVPKLAETAQKYVQPASDYELAFWMEMILEGMHQSLRLAREDLDSTITFQELMKFNVLRTVK